MDNSTSNAPDDIQWQQPPKASATAPSTGAGDINWNATAQPTPQLKPPSSYSVLDPIKEIGAGALEGVGSIVSGIGSAGQLAARPIVAGINSAANAPVLDAPVNAFKPAGDLVSNLGQKLRGTESQAAQTADAQQLYQGSLLHPSTLRLGYGATNPIAYAQGLASGAGQAVPMLLGGLEAKAAELPGEIAAKIAGGEALSAAEQATVKAAGQATLKRTLATGASIGGLQGAQSSADAEEQRIMQMTPDQLSQLPGYQQRLQSGMSPDQAQQDLAKTSSSNTFGATLPVATAAGLAGSVPFLRGAQEALAEKAGTSILKRVGAGAAIEAPTQGAIGVAQQAAQTAAGNATTGENRSLTDNSAEAFAGGAIAGGIFGGAGAIMHHAPAAPGSLTDVANTIADTAARAEPVLKRNAAAASASPVTADPSTLTEAAAITNPASAPTPTTAPSAQSTRIAPAPAPWMDPTTGEVTPPTKDQLTAALADHITAQYAASGDMRINTGDIADAWGVPRQDVNRARNAATKAATANVADAERAAMNQARAGAPAPVADNAADTSDNGEAATATTPAPRSFDDISNDIDATHNAVSQRLDSALQPDGSKPDVPSPTDQDPGQPLHPWTPIDSTQRVPYTGGVASDGQKIYLDPALPEELNVDGKTVNAHDAVAYHESVEFPLMHLTGPMSDDAIQQLAERAGLKSPNELPPQVVSDLKEGKSLDYAPAHDIATQSENKYVADKYDVDPEKYQTALTGAIDAARDQAPGSGQVPTDLDPKPYVNMDEAALANGVEPTNADAANEETSDATADTNKETTADSVPETGDSATAPAGSTDGERPTADTTASAGSNDAAATADASEGTQQGASKEEVAKQPQAPAPEAKQVAKPYKPSAFAKDAEGLRVKTPDGEINGRTHVDQLINQGYNRVESQPAGNKLVHSMVNDAGERQPIKARQLRYAQEATDRVNASPQEAPVAETSTDATDLKASKSDAVPAKREQSAQPLAEKKAQPARGGIATNGARTRVNGGTLEYVPGARETLEAYFKPGRIVDGYGGAKDKVLGFNWNDGSWNVRVQHVNPDGSEIADKRLSDAHPRIHGTAPDRKELYKVLGNPEMPLKALGKPIVSERAAKVEAAAAESAHSPLNDRPEPTEAQKEAGNYAKGHVSLHGLDISIENPRGSERSGLRENGTMWSHQMSDHYGYVRGTEGADKEHVDVYIGPKPESQKVYVVDQVNQHDGSFDEHKGMLGFTSKDAAVAAYKSNFDEGWKVGKVQSMSMDEFKAWLKDGDLTKPAADRVAAEREPNFSFAGEASKTADRDALEQAKHVELVGRDQVPDRYGNQPGSPDETHMATGWSRGADGKWRYEIDDSEANVKTDALKDLKVKRAMVEDLIKRREAARADGDGKAADKFTDRIREANKAYEAAKTPTMADVLEHSKLFAAYPDLANVRVRVDPDMKSWGSYNPSRNDVTIRSASDYPPTGNRSLKSVLLHELQHAIQEREGFARGGSVAEARTLPEYEQLLTQRMMDAKEDVPSWTSVKPNDKEVAESAALQVYRRLAGEVEARNTQTRMDMSPEARRAVPPGDTQDVGRSDQIVRFNGGDANDMGVPKDAETARVKSQVDELTKNWKGDDLPNVKVVATPEDLPASAKRGADGSASNEYQRARGMYDGKNVYVVASAHPDTEAGRAQLRSTLMHEAIGHYGVDRIVTRELGAGAWSHITDAFQRLESDGKGSADMQSVLADVRKRYGDIDKNGFAQEALAVMAERGIKNGLLDRAIAAIRQFVRKFMPDLKLSESELRQLLVKSSDYLDRGQTYAQKVQSRAAMAFDKGPPEDTNDRGEPEDGKRPRKPFSKASASIEAIHEQLPKLDQNAFEKAKAWIGGKARDMEPAALGALQLRHLLELAGEEKVLEGPAKAYAELFQRLDGDRNAMTVDGAGKAQKLQSWAYERGPAGWRGKLKPEAQDLFKFMHEVTQVSIDPTDAYEKLLMRDSRGQQMPWTDEARRERIKALKNQMRGRSGDDKTPMQDEIKDLQMLPARERARQQKYPELVAKWNSLTPQAKEMFSMMRDHYSEMSQQLQDASIARIKALDIPRQNKLAAMDLINRNFEDAKVGGVYFPLMRFGDYWISAHTKDGEYTFAKYETAQQAEEAEKRFKAGGADIEAVGRNDSNYKSKNAPSGTFIGELMGTLRESKAPEGVMDDIYQMYLKTLPELSLRKRGIHRNNVAGYTDNVPRAFASSVFHGAHQVSKARYGFQLADTMETMKERLDAKRTAMSVGEAAHADALLGELSRRHDWIMNPTSSKLASKMSSIAFAYHLSASPASALTYLLQMPQIVLPVLGAHHGWVPAMRELGSATKDAIRTVGNIDRVLKGDDLMAYKALQKQGTFQRTASHTLAGLSEGDNLRANPAYAKVMNAVSWMFHKAEVINREATGMAAYRLGRANGQSFDEAVKYADQMTNGTHGDYSNANRARYMQGNVAKVALQFKSYSLAMSWLWGRQFYQAFKGETPEVRSVARKTLTGLTGMTGLMAGAMGLPMINALRYTANAVHAISGDSDQPYDFDTEFRSWLDEHLGSTAGGVIADGAANQLGADVADRTSMSDLWFRDVDRQLEGESAYDNLLESIAGPLGGMIKNMYVGAQQYNQGHVERGIETMMPTAAKNAMKAMRYAHEGVNSLRGDPIVPDVGAAGDLVQALGFTPTKVADQMRINNALENYSAFIQTRRSALMNAYAMATTAGDDSGQTDSLQQIQDFNAKYPEIKISMGSLRDSLKGRAKASEEAQNGIVLNKRIANRVQQDVGVQPGQ